MTKYTSHIELPPLNTRWTPSRKAQVVYAIEHGQITAAEAATRYGLSTEELASWKSLIGQHGPRGLRATRMQEYRPADTREINL